MEIRQMQRTGRKHLGAGLCRLFHRAGCRAAKETDDGRSAADRRITPECVVHGLLTDGDKERSPELRSDQSRLPVDVIQMLRFRVIRLEILITERPGG